MALIKTLAEIKDVLPRIVSTLSNTSLFPNWEKAEYKYIVPLIGPALYEDLNTKYNTVPDPTSVKEKALLKKLRLVTIAYSYRDELGLMNLTIGDTGARKQSQGGVDRVYGWEYQEMKNALIDAAMDGTEVLLNYLYDNKADWALWTDSANYTKYISLLIKGGTDFNDQYNLFQPARTWWTLRGIMNDVQELYLQEAIGKDLLIYLLDKISPTDKETECIRLLKKSLAYLTVFKGCQHYSVSFTDGGFTILGQKMSSTVESGAAGSAELSSLDIKMNECERQGKDFLAKARNTIVALYSDVDATVDFKTAFDKGKLISYTQPVDRTSGNEERKIFVL